ncbi:hypothetical protein PHLGIDRAFT_30220 [Phlebiopsis gigantea 11061_1 CR5-6]|uniref:Glucose-methanol-choline oxidoreductase N-terminal domain-containing protein n=1 Tax=Phlebiopsis gigantea (strain 11061_1 CR5-6) TaxID=745531 RepID=A0A0C3NPC2_PHLG1|nr:hypothetical protein PHLGIDRAFT_30220 [Phlebiopsis gigantea 11061_1 CR5-6]
MWPFSVTSYPQKSPQELDGEYDYIIVGGGTAGCVLARRLADDRRCTVLLVERGDTRNNFLDRFPLLSTHQFSGKKHSVVTTARFTADRDTEVIAGKGLGGTSRINGMQYTRAVPGEFNAWARAGRKGWSYDEMVPYFQRAERLWSPVQAPPNEFFFGCSAQIARAAERIGLANCKDVNDASLPTSGHYMTHQTVDQSGNRSSTYRAYLPQDFALAHKDHLHICTNTIARKVELSRTEDGSLRATGVILQATSPGAPSLHVSARKEVILACGALVTPQILMLSGIGPADHLKSLDVLVIHPMEGVGANLQDHVGAVFVTQCPLWDSIVALFVNPWSLMYQMLRFLILGDGWFRYPYMELSIFTKKSFLDQEYGQRALSDEEKDSSRSENIPDIEIMTGAICNFHAPGFNQDEGGFCMLPTVLRPASRGTVRLASSDPLDTPLYDFNYLSAPEDRAVLRAGVRLCMRLTREMRAAGYAAPDFTAPASGSDADVDAFVAAHGQSFFHFASSCRMAPVDDPAGPGVVDDALRVHGVPNLRVCDASVFPQVPAAHLQAPVIAVAEKCADMVKETGRC